MNDNGKAGEKLDKETMEQVSGGYVPLPTKSEYCDKCKETTTWIYLNGNYICGKCGRGPVGVTQFV